MQERHICTYLVKEKPCGKRAVGFYQYQGYILYLCRKHKDIVDEYGNISKELLEKAVVYMGIEEIC